MWHPEQCDAFIAVVVAVDEEDAVGFAQFAFEAIAFLGEGGGVDEGYGYVLLGESGGWDGDWWEDGLEFAGYEGISDQAGEEGGFALRYMG